MGYMIILDQFEGILIMILQKEVIEIEGESYEMCGQIGQGTVGHVYIIKNAKDSRRYALKMIRQYGRNPIIKSMVDQQISVQKQFEGNSHIIQIYAHKEESKRKYIIFELGSCSLRNKMQMEPYLILTQFIDIVLDTTKGLTAIHNKNFIHRDIKPENVICVDQTYKITDFGSLQAGTVGQGVVGTPLYLAAEMLFDEEKEYNQKIDIWSLGVSLFQVYFRIHPFYYSRDLQNHKLVYRQLKQNIKALTPDFTIERFLSHILKKQLISEYNSVRNKLIVTPKQVIDQFTYFFNQPSERPQIDIFNGVFQSLESTCRERPAQQVKLKIGKEKIPSDIIFYIDTLNMFYKLCSLYGNEKMNDIEFHLELGMWYWNFYNYLGQDYLHYSNHERLKLYKKDKEILWKEVQQSLFNYWLEITSNSELTFFQPLPILKLRMLICATRFKIYRSLQKFLKQISKKVEMAITTLQQLEMMFSVFEMKQIKSIEDTVLNLFLY